jgi:hypothetical protein
VYTKALLNMQNVFSTLGLRVEGPKSARNDTTRSHLSYALLDVGTRSLLVLNVMVALIIVVLRGQP